MESSIKDKFFLITVIVLVSLIGFGLGRLSSKYQTAELNINSTIANVTDLSKVIASAPLSTNSSSSKSDSNNTKNNFISNNSPNTAESRDIGVASVVKIIGNKQSKIYHREDCPGALKMSESNKVFFDSISSAKEAGYRPAGNCPGLE